MFGEENILGQSEQKTDDKGRMIIPAWTKREAGDSLVCIKDENLGVYKIYNRDKFDRIIKELESRKQKCESLKKLKVIEKFELKFYKSIVTEAKLDRQGRYLIGKELASATVNVIGAGECLVLELKN